MGAVSLLRREDAQTMAEYAVVLAVITPVIVASFALLSDSFISRVQSIAGFFG